jgi:hypothetical protein
LRLDSIQSVDRRRDCLCKAILKTLTRSENRPLMIPDEVVSTVIEDHPQINAAFSLLKRIQVVVDVSLNCMAAVMASLGRSARSPKTIRSIHSRNATPLVGPR